MLLNHTFVKIPVWSCWMIKRKNVCTFDTKYSKIWILVLSKFKKLICSLHKKIEKKWNQTRKNDPTAGYLIIRFINFWLYFSFYLLYEIDVGSRKTKRLKNYRKRLMKRDPMYLKIKHVMMPRCRTSVRKWTNRVRHCRLKKIK